MTSTLQYLVTFSSGLSKRYKTNQYHKYGIIFSDQQSSAHQNKIDMSLIKLIAYKSCLKNWLTNCLSGSKGFNLSTLNIMSMLTIVIISMLPGPINGNTLGLFRHSANFLPNQNSAKPQISDFRITADDRGNIKAEWNINTAKDNIITENGIIYSIISSREENETRIKNETDEFSIVLNGLPRNKEYRIKVYAINEEGINYSPEIQFNTFDLPQFTSLLPTEVNYNQQLFNYITTATGQETMIDAVSIPDWLTLSDEPTTIVVAGSELAGFSNGIGNKSSFVAPYALAANEHGDIFVADQADNRIRKISRAGEVSTVAGAIPSGYADGNSTEARFNVPSGITVDSEGNIYVSDLNNHSIRKISQTGNVVTIAGSQKAGRADGQGTEAQFKNPAGICMDSMGFLYVADRGNNLIRKISPQGFVSTLAGSGQAGFADGKGKMARFNAPAGITVDQSGFVYVADQVNNRIRKISPTGEVSTLAGNGEFGNRNGEANQAAFKYPTSVAIDAAENLYVSDQLNHSIRKISKSGKVSTIRISSKPDNINKVKALSLKNPAGLCFNKDGNLILADYHNHNIKEINFNPILFGTPAKSNLGSCKVILKATNEYGSTTLESEILVSDRISPKIIKTIPENLAVGIDRTSDITIFFDEEIAFADSGSVLIYHDEQMLNRYELGNANSAGQIRISDDYKSLVIKLKDLPAASRINIRIDEGIVKDYSGNKFQNNLSSKICSFTTKPKQKQTLAFRQIDEKTYGDPVFKIGPSHSIEGLPITYTAEDSNIIYIQGDSAKILHSGKTRIIASQKGDDNYLADTIIQALNIKPMPIIIKPHAGQQMTYGSELPDMKFDIISGQLLHGARFTGKLSKLDGDSTGIYPIVMGSLALNTDYRIKLEYETIEVIKAVLTIKAKDQSKIAGAPNPVFTCSYEGFVNGDDYSNLTKLPEFSCKALTNSLIGTYEINPEGAEAKNYTIQYQSGTLTVLSNGEAEFDVEYRRLLENMPSGTETASLLQKKNQVKLDFKLINGEGSEDNRLFRISGNSIVTTIPLNYEEKQQFSIRVRSEGPFGQSEEKMIKINLIDVNERPYMNPIEYTSICSEGTLQLFGINAGPEHEQKVKITIESNGLGSKNYFEVSEPLNGTASIKYSLPDKIKNLSLRITLIDNGGTLNGGIDSTVYRYLFNVETKTPVQISSEKGKTLLRGSASVLYANGKGRFEWYFNNQKIEGENSGNIKIIAQESGVYRVKLISDGACISEGQIQINVEDKIIVSCTNVITPNSDGINDAFIARNIEQFPENELWILDRTGKLVYHKKGYSNDWQGTSNGYLLPNGTYYYILELDKAIEKLKGFISVLYEH